MKITFLLTAGLERPAGIRYAGLAQGLTRRGHEVTILALHPNFNHVRPRRFRQQGVDVCYVGQMHARKLGSRPTRFGPLQLLQVVLHSTAALAWAAATIESDVLHLGKAQPINGMAAVLANRLRPRPLYLDCDDYEAGSNRFSAPWQRAIFAWWEDQLPRLMNGVTVNTTFLRQRVASLGVPEDRIVQVPNGVDLHTFQPEAASRIDGLRSALGLEGHRVITYAGTLSLQNHPIDLLLEAFPALLRHEPRAMALIIGGGEDLVMLRERVRRSELQDVIRFAGHVGPSLLRALMGLAELSVDPVRDDAVARARSPLKIFESMALGIPVVTADVGDRRMMLADGAAGLLVRPGDPAALADGIAELLASPATLKAASAYALRHVQTFDWSELAARFETVYAR